MRSIVLFFSFVCRYAYKRKGFLLYAWMLAMLSHAWPHLLVWYLLVEALVWSQPPAEALSKEQLEGFPLFPAWQRAWAVLRIVFSERIVFVSILGASRVGWNYYSIDKVLNLAAGFVISVFHCIRGLEISSQPCCAHFCFALSTWFSSWLLWGRSGDILRLYR